MHHLLTAISPDQGHLWTRVTSHFVPIGQQPSHDGLSAIENAQKALRRCLRSVLHSLFDLVRPAGSLGEPYPVQVSTEVFVPAIEAALVSPAESAVEASWAGIQAWLRSAVGHLPDDLDDVLEAETRRAVLQVANPRLARGVMPAGYCRSAAPDGLQAGNDTAA